MHVRWRKIDMQIGTTSPPLRQVYTIAPIKTTIVYRVEPGLMYKNVRYQVIDDRVHGF